VAVSGGRDQEVLVDGARAIARGEKVWLRAFEAGDLEPYWAAVNNVDVAYRAGYVAPTSRDGVRDWYESKVRREQGQAAFYFVISPIGSDDFVGSIWLWQFDSRLGGPELSIFIADPARWGQGLGVDAVNAMMDFAFGSLDLERVWLFTDADNPRSIKAFAKAGFVEEGTLRQSSRGRGARGDSILMGMLRSDWAALDRKRSWEL
jgi:RimJ/RimL family protein N-acetyltransferase